ncbi:Golgin subfamily A member 5 [Hypsibius exemplaris]|uniref:Golgin subfamily A member 5 n=1 Tax=Hypsibius exemplaris TaxID=2072580 RepID=A0A9X6NE29_HYPEX|nr:Golgin subfamily A member 5 [Hypsibius exemplaris]
MAWLQGLAGKAEGLLNKMDQTAAVSLHSPGSTEKLNATIHSDQPSGGWNSMHRIRRSGSNSSTVSDFTDGGTGRYQQGEGQVINEMEEQGGHFRRTASSQSMNQAHDYDGEWTAVSSSSSPRAKQHKRSASARKPVDMFEELNATSFASEKGTADGADGTGEDGDEVVEDGGRTAVRSASQELTTGGSVDSLARENQLMKSELQSQARELSMALNRVKRAEQDSQKLLNQLSAERQRFASENDTRERDFLTALTAKDSQAAALRLQFEQIERDWKTAEARLTEAGIHVKRLEQLSSSYSLQDLAAEESARRLAEMEAMLQSEKDHAAEQIERLKTTIRILEDQNRDYLNSIAVAERSRVSDQNSLEDLKRQLNLMTTECEMAQRELSDYKQKALKILQSKDELITALKSGNGVVTDESADLEASEIELERDMLRDEVVKLRESTEKLSRHIGERESQYKRDCAELREQYVKVEQMALAGADRCRDMDASLKSSTEEITYIRNEAARKEQSLQQRLKDRDEDLQRIRQQLLTRSESRPSDVELESRMHVLTENLIQKQSTIETLNTEKHAMSVQIERLEKRLRDAPKAAYQESRIAVTSDSSADSSAGGFGRTSSFLMENESDNKVARQLKKAYSTVDRFSFRLGIFLRRYPLARVMVIAYMLLLHFWVLVVLLTYTPEIHSHETPPGRK